MSTASRVRRLEASVTARQVIDGWLDVALGHPSRDAYATDCLATDPPSHPLSRIRAELGRLAASQPAATRAGWLRRTEGDALVLYHLADGIQLEAADAPDRRYHVLAHHRLRLEPLLRPAASGADPDERPHLLALWVPAARRAVYEDELEVRACIEVERRYFRGRDLRYRESVEADGRVRIERLILDRWLEIIGAEVPDGAVPIGGVDAVRVADEVNRRLQMAQWQALMALGEEQRADALLRAIAREQGHAGASPRHA
ncbi:MAG: hypothetical protein ABIR11_10770 [Candidatus Limnocylindrales bacterium]